MPHSLAGRLLGASYAAARQALLLLPLPRDGAEPGQSAAHQADAAAAGHSSQLSSPPPLQSSDDSTVAVPETAATPLERRGSAATPGEAPVPEQRTQQGPEVPHLSMACGQPGVEAQPAMPATARDACMSSAQPAAAVLPMGKHPSDPRHAGTEDMRVPGQGQHAERQQGIGAAPAPQPDRRISGELCCGRGPVHQARCAVLVPCCEAVHGRFPLNGTYFQTNEVFLDASSLECPVTVSRSGTL